MKTRQLPIRPITNIETATAFVFGLIFNQNIKAEKAWEAPFVLAQRLGTIEPAKIIELSDIPLANAIINRPALHPFGQRMAEHIYETSKILASKYAGDARNIWKPKQTTDEILKRLQEFPGIGKHKATVGVFLLKHELGVPIKEGGAEIDIRATCPSLYRIYG